MTLSATGAPKRKKSEPRHPALSPGCLDRQFVRRTERHIEEQAARRRREEKQRNYFRDEVRRVARQQEQRPTRAVGIRLHRKERVELSGIVSRGKSEQRMVLRARIVLLAATNVPNKEIAREVDCSEKTVRKWRRRFARLRMDGLLDAPRDGRRPKFTNEQRHLVVVKALSEPPFPITCWSLSDLAEAVVKDGIVTAISKETIGRWLREGEIRPHRNKYWLNIKDPDFDAKMAPVIDLYLNPPKDGMVWCVDEKTGIQALRRKAAKIPVRCGHCQRVEFEYERKGTASLLAAFHTATGHVVGRCFSKLNDEKNDSQTFIKFLQDLMVQYPKKPHGKLYIILDNASTHTSHETTAFFEKHKNRLKPVFLPIHGSWLNQVEIFFSVLTRRVLRHSSYNSVSDLIAALHAYIKLHNEHKHPYNWTYKGRPLTL